VAFGEVPDCTGAHGIPLTLIWANRLIRVEAPDLQVRSRVGILR